MRRDEFSYDLPEDLIAQFPPDQRGDSRLLVMESPSGKLTDLEFSSLPDLLNAGDLLVFNDTRVIPARLFGHKETGGKVEILLERILNDQRMLAQIRSSKTLKPGSVIQLQAGFSLKFVERQNDMFVLDVLGDISVLELMQQVGHMPLPPYIQREDHVQDQDRYQTVYAKIPGAVAAPTAGLHFTDGLMQKITEQGIDCVFVTLHVGAGTFQPVRVDNIEDHQMHHEYLEISADVCEKVKQCRARGGRVIAVGTTAVRCLETASDLKPYQGETNIFIYPGYKFKVVDALITNFHLSESTLLMLVSAFSGRDNIMKAYQHAIGKQYRFFSYGDAMFLMKEEE
ncbi:MAG: S-adenosylmethionine:tRNA ribosyltransferase-isomerase [Gammaproteobacteria bacterium]|jgi:S-adenosylmethionine:tRNA ribosyltransferase-isomerase